MQRVQNYIKGEAYAEGEDDRDIIAYFSRDGSGYLTAHEQTDLPAFETATSKVAADEVMFVLENIVDEYRLVVPWRNRTLSLPYGIEVPADTRPRIQDTRVIYRKSAMDKALGRDSGPVVAGLVTSGTLQIPLATDYTAPENPLTDYLAGNPSRPFLVSPGRVAVRITADGDPFSLWGPCRRDPGRARHIRPRG